MKRINSLMIIIALALSVSYSVSCNAKNEKVGKQVAEKRSVKGFNSVVMRGIPTVHYTQGKKYSVEVKAPENLIQYVITEIDDDSTLVIDLKDRLRNLKDTFEVIVNIASPNIYDVTMAGSGSFISEKLIATSNLKMNISGSGNIALKEKVTCKDANFVLSGSGNIKVPNLEAAESNIIISGSGNINVTQHNVDNTSITLSGSGNINVSQHNVDHSSISLAGSGDIKVTFDDCNMADASLAGSGNIYLKGTLKTLKKHKTGVGRIHEDIVK